MQSLTAAPRTAFTSAQITTLLTGPRVTVTPGLDRLDGSNNVVEDLTPHLLSGQVDRNCNADVHGTIDLKLSKLLAWGKDRIQPYMVLDDGNISARFNLGVFVLTTPEEPRGETPITYDVVGYDLLHFLQAGPGDTYSVASGTTYFAAIQAVLTASGVGATVQLDGTAQATTLVNPMVWMLTINTATSWLRIINDLLGAIDYRGLWVDQDGIFRSSPYTVPSARAIEWQFNTADPYKCIVGENRTLTSDVWGAFNWFKFVRKGMVVQPTEANGGIYIVNDPSPTGRASQTALGRVKKAPVQYLDAADSASLISQGNRFVAANQAISRIFNISTGPFPIAGHFDVVELTDAGEVDKCQVTSWSIPLNGDLGTWTLESVNA